MSVMDHRVLRRAVPAVALFAAVLAWEAFVRLAQVPHFILPAPSRVLVTLWENLGSLAVSWLFTLKITFGALALAAAGGVLLAAVFALSPIVELALVPFAVVLQVTPIVAIAPLIIILVKDTQSALVICATIIAIFPIISNTTVGLRSVDQGHQNLFAVNRASRLQNLIYLRIPSALPFFFAGLRVSSGLALIGAVVAEFVAGTGGTNTGLAYRILEAGYRLQIPRMFAALLLISLTGILIFVALSLVSHLILRRWHESAVRREN